jgi:predicted nucleic acid-binding protein
MLSRVTLDASVAVSASFPAEASFEDSHRLLERLVQAQVMIVVPSLIRPEIAAAVRRATGDPDEAKALEETFSTLPGVIFKDLDSLVADMAVKIAATAGLRGADAVYAAIARRFDATLITLDGEQRTRLPADIITLYPAEALEAM